ncbi:MAG: Ig-like domain-containing protein [Candidatus Roizmanbacteria bacterium]|nr:Ig-like domain-containing protein [Candidatus Roizmanbacteria bacterium]
MDKKLGGLLLVFFLLFTVFASSILFSTQLSSITRAKEDYVPSAKASLLFAYPLLVKADGTTKSTISVFIRSDKGMPVKDRKVTITATIGQLNMAEVTTDEKGKATATLTSTAKGISVIGAAIDGTLKMTQPLSITFE